MGLPDARREGGGVDRETVVHRHDLDLAGLIVLHGMIGAVVSLFHLHGARAQGEGEHLVPKADAEYRDPGVDGLADDGAGIGAGCCRVTRAVGEDDAVGGKACDFFPGGACRHDCQPGADRCQGTKNVALHAVVDDDNVEPACCPRSVALRPLPTLLVECPGAGGRHFAGEVHAFEARPLSGLAVQGIVVDCACRLMHDDAVGHSLLADAPGEGAGVDAAEPDDAMTLEPDIEMLGAAVIRWIGDASLYDHSACGRGSGLDVLEVRADIADMGEGEADDLGGVGGVCQDLLIAGHGGVEAHFADGLSYRAEAEALEHSAVGENKRARDSLSRAGRAHLAGSIGRIHHFRKLAISWDFGLLTHKFARP